MRIVGKFFLLLIVLSSSVLVSCFRSGEEDLADPEQYEKEQKEIENYLIDNGFSFQRDSLFGLYYVIEEMGDGPAAYDSAWVNVTFNGSILGSGTNFIEEDSVYYPMYGLISGWRILLPQIEAGGRIRMYIPSFYGFGENTALEGAVPPNSTLEFDVELHDVFNQRGYERLLVNEYIEVNELDAKRDSISGLFYVMLEEGEGESPTAESAIIVDYEGRTLVDDEVFDSGTEALFRLSDLIDGWKALMPLVKEGGTILMIIYSDYGYGPQEVGPIPPNSTLVFEVTLVDVLE